MKKHRNNIVYVILFCLLMVFLFSFMIQEQFGLFEFRKLSGYEEPTPKPVFSLKDYKNGDFQYDLEQYVSENLGFREPIIRMYNQYVYDFYKKTYNQEVAIEKDGWLYHSDGIKQYYGWMNEKFHLTDEEFQQQLDAQIRSLYKTNEILKEYGVGFQCFTLPTKTYIFPQHLGNHRFADTAFKANEHFEKSLSALGVPNINMNSWFQKVQDTLPFPLFPQKGSHWAAGAPLAVDTMLRLMESTNGRKYPDITLGEPYPVYDVPNDDKDLECLLNLWRPQKNDPVYEYPVSLKLDNETQFPSVLFVGTSFYWYMKRRVPFDALFTSRDFYFYCSLFYSEKETVVTSNKDQVDLLWEILTHDNVVYFLNGPQLYMDGFFFASRALRALCISDSRYQEKLQEVADSLMTANHADATEREKYLYKAKLALEKDPELFEELRGEAVPTARNPRIEKILVERNILNNARWKALLEAKADNDSLPFKPVLSLEASNILTGVPSLTENMFLTSYHFFDVEVKTLIDSLRHSPVYMDSILSASAGSFNDNVLFESACQIVRQRIEQGGYNDNTSAIRAFTIQQFLASLNNKTSLDNMAQKAQDQHKSLKRAIEDDALWVWSHREKPIVFDEAQIGAFWEQYLIEHRIRNYPESVNRVRQKAADKGKPFLFALMDDVIYNYNQANDNR